MENTIDLIQLFKILEVYASEKDSYAMSIEELYNIIEDCVANPDEEGYK